MLPKREYYDIYPSIIPADRESEITITALERCFIFEDGAEYTVTVYPVNSDEECYHKPTTRTVLNVKAEGGVIRFKMNFTGEQEHLVLLNKGDVSVEKFNVFSLNADLYDLIPMKLDLHSHSYRSDGTRDPAALAGYYREQGYDGFALTDHNRYYPGGEIDEVYEGVNSGFLHIPGEEVHAPRSVVHIVHVGGNESVTEKYFKYPEVYDKEIEEYLSKVPSHIPEKYVGRYARAMWATDKIHKAGGIAIFPHPYWRPAGRVYNVCNEFAMLLLKSGMFDAYEIVGGMAQADMNMSVALWNELRSEGYDIPVVGSSDAHRLENSPFFPFNFTICFAEKPSTEGVVNAVKSGLSVAVETNNSDENTRQWRAYGKLRLVTYAQFLLKHYFPRIERLRAGEGVAMRAYAMHDAPKELIEMHAELADKFRTRFFGITECKVPSDEIVAFESNWRNIQRNGPKTKGSDIYATPNFQI